MEKSEITNLLIKNNISTKHLGLLENVLSIHINAMDIRYKTKMELKRIGAWELIKSIFKEKRESEILESKRLKNETQSSDRVARKQIRADIRNALKGTTLSLETSSKEFMLSKGFKYTLKCRKCGYKQTLTLTNILSKKHRCPSCDEKEELIFLKNLAQGNGFDYLKEANSRKLRCHKCGHKSVVPSRSTIECKIANFKCAGCDAKQKYHENGFLLLEEYKRSSYSHLCKCVRCGTIKKVAIKSLRCTFCEQSLEFISKNNKVILRKIEQDVDLIRTNKDLHARILHFLNAETEESLKWLLNYHNMKYSNLQPTEELNLNEWIDIQRTNVYTLSEIKTYLLNLENFKWSP